MTRRKISLIGGGNIGGTLAHIIASKELADVVIFDINAGMAAGKALDLSQCGSSSSYDVKISGTDDYSSIKNSDVIIVTAGIPRKPGMSRDDLIEINSNIIKTVAANIKTHAPDSFVIVITNPLDAMVWVMREVTEFAPHKVVGMAGTLDSARFSYFLSLSLGVATEDVKTMVLGGHGDTMVPLISATSVSGIPLTHLVKAGMISEDEIAAIIARTADGGAEIVKLLGNGSAYYAPAISAVIMAESYLKDQKRLLPAAAYLTGQYGVHGLYIGVPVVIGAGGVEKIIELPLSGQEKTMFDKSAAAVKSLIASIKNV